MELLGLDVDGEVLASDVVTAVVVIAEVIDGDGRRYLRVLGSDMPVWHRLGMVEAVVALDRAELAEAFEEDG